MWSLLSDKGVSEELLQHLEERLRTPAFFPLNVEAEERAAGAQQNGARGAASQRAPRRGEPKRFQRTAWHELEEQLPKTRILVIPGGRDLPYLEAVQNENLSQLLQGWVSEGGVVLAICAGAYFVSESVAFDLGGPHEVRGDRPLRWIPGTAVGPMPWAPPFTYLRGDGAMTVQLETVWTSEPLPTLYYGGCTWKEALSSEVLARYPCGSPAIVQQSIGSGWVVASGVHPEASKALLYGDLPHSCGEHPHEAPPHSCGEQPHEAPPQPPLGSCAPQTPAVGKAKGMMQFVHQEGESRTELWTYLEAHLEALCSISISTHV